MRGTARLRLFEYQLEGHSKHIKKNKKKIRSQLCPTKSLICLDYIPYHMMGISITPNQEFQIFSKRCSTTSLNSVHGGIATESDGRCAEHTTTLLVFAFLAFNLHCNQVPIAKLGTVLPCTSFRNTAALDLQPPLWQTSWLSMLFMPLTCSLKNQGSCIRHICVCTLYSLLLSKRQAALLCCKFICHTSNFIGWHGFMAFLPMLFLFLSSQFQLPILLFQHSPSQIVLPPFLVQLLWMPTLVDHRAHNSRIMFSQMKNRY